jgi:hypothetical protein
MLKFLKGKAASCLRVEFVRQSYSFRMHIQPPLETLKRLILFLDEYQVIVDHLQIDRYSSGAAMLLIRCQVEKSKACSFTQRLEVLPGVFELERIDP